MSQDFSVVIPVLNEQESLRQLFSEIQETASEIDCQWEVIFIDDGSTDDSWNVIQELSQEQETVHGLQFRRNFGKASALSAGIAQSQYPLIFTMDADLQDNPKELPTFLQQIDAGFDIVSGWKEVRNDPLGKTLPSKVFNRLVSWLTGLKLHDHNCGFKCYRREVFSEIKLYGELHRFIPVLGADRGFKVSEVSVDHRSRKHGVSKYGWRRIYRGLLDLLTVIVLTNYRQRPQHFMGALGGCSFLTGTLGLGIMACYWILRQFSVLDPQVWEPLHQRPIVLYSLGALLLGAQLLAVGILAELITAQSAGTSATYSIRQRTSPKS